MFGRRLRPLAATVAAAFLAAALVQSGSGANPPAPPPGAIGYGIQVPPAGEAFLFQFHFQLKGGAALPTAMLPTGTHAPAGLKLYLDLYMSKSGGVELNALIVNPFRTSGATTPAPSGAMNFWIVPTHNETLSPAGSGPSFPFINQWPAAPPPDCKSGALANRSVFAPNGAAGFFLNDAGSRLDAINALLSVVLPMRLADDLICDRPTSAAQAMSLDLPYLQTNYGTGFPTDVKVSWHDLPGTPPDIVLITGFPAPPTLAGRDAKECAAGSRATENFVSCKPRAGQTDLRLQPKTSPRFKIKNLKAAFLFKHVEFGPFG